MKDIEQLRAKVAAFEVFLKEAQDELLEAIKEEYRDKLKAQKLEPPITYELEVGCKDDPLYSPEAARDMMAEVQIGVYTTSDGKNHWYMVTEEPQEYQGA